MQNTFLFDEMPPVQTTAGLVKGYQYNGLSIFKGIPYAQAARFQMPQPVTPWDGVRDATSYGFVCPLLTQDTPSAELMVPHRYWPQDENCQNLNIWTPSTDPAAHRPVMVWLHGGGYTAGSSIEQDAYDGANMCRHGDVVVVSVNHRLNILGYLDMSPFGEKYANSANAGHADLVAALRWVRDNITAFGGDAENVTIFGQSGGGMKVTGLMQIPEADGLFHKGIVMSGVQDGTLLPLLPGDGRAIVEAMLAALGIPQGEVERLEAVPYHDLAQAYNSVNMAIAMQGHYVGGVPMPNEYYLGEPLLTGFTDHAKTIPLMIGTVYGEFAFGTLPFNKAELSRAQMLDILRAQYAERTEEAAALFEAAYPSKKLVDLLTLDRVFRAPSKRLARQLAEGGQACAYLYNFTLDFPIQQGKPAWHCSDIPFFFHNTDRVEICGIPGVAQPLEEILFGAVMRFARTGNPGADALSWPPVTTMREPTMIFDRECGIREDYDDALLALIEEALPPFNLMAMMAAQDVQH